ncbi:hypothetical protein AX16_003746 [Volvariella volvacea WC 439]|nr:hypothetical protein AX16_003746 [Volvariella volvacea WC 439]
MIWLRFCHLTWDQISALHDQVEQINANVNAIADLQRRSLGAVDGTLRDEIEHLHALRDQARQACNNVMSKMKAFEQGRDQQSQIERNRLAIVRNEFIKAIRNYQTIEQEYQVRSREQMERQIRIVKPDATPDEMTAMMEGGGQQIFAQALSASSRYGESRVAYRAVQDRHQELLQMEQTLTELSQLFIDMGTLVEQQQETVEIVESTAGDIEADTGKGLEHTREAVKRARRWRNLRITFFVILVIIAAVLAIVLGVIFGRRNG